MVDDNDDDIKEWLAENAATVPFERLRRFRAENPDAPIPVELECTALIAPIVNEDENRIGFDVLLSEQIDRLIAEDEASKGGGSYKEWRPETFARIDDLAREGALSLQKAIYKVLGELDMKGIYDDRDALTRSYHRHAHKTLIDRKSVV